MLPSLVRTFAVTSSLAVCSSLLLNCGGKDSPSKGGNPGGDGDGDGSGGDGAGGAGPMEPNTNYNCDPAEGTIPTLGLSVVADGLNRPVLVTHAPNDPRLFVVELSGVIRVIENDALVALPLLDITSKVRTAQNEGERGLLGLAFHPRFAENGRFYVHYSAEADGTEFSQGATVLSEFRMAYELRNVAEPESERVLLSVPQPESNHNGGTVTFGPDGMLYLGLGDGGGGGDPYEHGQDETTLLGALLRIDPDGRSAGEYGIPAGNLAEIVPTAAPEIYSYGLRNPYRFNFDACTKDLYIGDVGQLTTEEINITKNGVGQLNYGWNTMEGSECYSPEIGCNPSGLTLPHLEYGREVGEYIAVTGGTVYRGSEIPALRGKYFYSDSSSNRIWHTEYDRNADTASAPVEITGEVGGRTIVSIQNGHDGEIYMTDLVAGDLLKLVAL